VIFALREIVGMKISQGNPQRLKILSLKLSVQINYPLAATSPYSFCPLSLHGIKSDKENKNNMKTRISYFFCPLAFWLGFSASAADLQLKLNWEKGMLRITGAFPGENLDIWYLEAFCRSGSTHRDWNKTTIPQKSELVSADADGKRLLLRTKVEPSVTVEHEIKAGADEVTFNLKLTNSGTESVDAQWFQPCMRVDRFTGLKQNDYHKRCFIFTKDELKRLDELPRAEEAIYKGGQVYVPEGIPIEDVNPRPISSIKPANGLIGCFSADDKWLLATAWDNTQELFQGVIVCIHNDPRIGGLKPGETKELHGKVYILPNKPDELLKRYRADFGK
jgi:hypothetical protein